MSTDLVLSRCCRHNDWWSMPQTSVEFCRSCGFSLIYATGRPSKDVYAEVQVQPRPQDTFDPARITSPGARSYQYQPLDLTNGRQIRVLVLKAGRLEDPLQCELEHVNLQQGPIYEALSYTWADDKGDDSISRAIQCGYDGQFIGITTNCELALLRLRKQDVDRRLWVDAVCIDQSNILERNHQVKNMIAIFRSAIRVVVFLGEGNPILDRLVDYMSNDTGGQLPQVTDFISLFRSRWFHRVWVLQEVAVAKSILVMYGMKQMSWVDLIRHGNLFLRLMAARNLSLVLPPVISYGLRQTEAGDRRLKGRSDLLSLLQVSRNCACKDARDKVYSILGLLQEEPVLSLQADYSPSTTAGWVFLQVAAWHVDTTKTLDILSQVDGTSALNMPSWVPDWTRKSPTALPAQLKELQECTAPLITFLDGQIPPSTAQLGYPLGCVLEVTGRRYGTVWTDRKIFGKAPVLLDSIVGATNGNGLGSQVFQSHLAWSKVQWLLNPSQNPGTQRCNKRLHFWERILSLYHRAVSFDGFNADTSAFRADIPPAFGGFCSSCFERDQMYWRKTRQAMGADIGQSIGQAISDAFAAWNIEHRLKADIREATARPIGRATEQVISPAIRRATEQVINPAIWISIEQVVVQATGRISKQAFEAAIELTLKETLRRPPRQAIKQATEQVINQPIADWAIEQHVARAIWEAIKLVISQAIEDTASKAFRHAIAGALEPALKQALQRAVGQVINQAIANGTIKKHSRHDIWKSIKRATRLAAASATNHTFLGAIERAASQVTQEAMVMIGQTTPSYGIKQASDRHINVVDRAIRDAMNRAIELASRKAACCCVSSSPSPGHFDKNELEKFMAIMSQYGMGRRIFGTDHSLGLGPMELEDWDEVWTLEGATVPFILRPVSDHYKLVGACYIHRASETAYRCSICSYETVRGEITLPAATQPATGAATSTGPSIEAKSSWKEGVARTAFSALSPGPFEEGIEWPFASTLSGSQAKIKIR
ncbi:hypothetical protein LCI18_008145 [Fusarium solani-melongenae]|uniref:Uncharacterized protein n=1 Tax=Fusarium solani subsp. cucurbitae TaxID=2747967 RepID=A0ACD3Z7W8_FUSSC|nr:hypothetical protein LCI18_008145 [Fusarium solani-melongenae]